MDNINIMPPEDVARMFARLGELTLDVSGIRRKYLGCAYGDDPKQALDIYLPNDGDGPFPIVFFIHGGAWAFGSKSDTQVVPFIYGVTRGYAVISLNYRLIPNIRYPENLFDIRAALRWTAENAGTYLLDTKRTALTGASAGAHLAMMAAFTQGQAAFGDTPDAPSCNILAVVEQFGPTDFSKVHDHFDESGYARTRHPNDVSEVSDLLGVDPRLIPNLMRFINPIDCVHPGIPPVLLQQGRYDPVIPYQQAVELFDKINTVAGAGMAELDLSEELLHADPGYAAPESVDRIFNFIDRFI
ncbi:MAG: alpha/beta hydrolase [Oscillospiraceae bacterium]|jgi:acetyl esterase/lipase|nr:alpha/beta hydrolase [Oscillospiraceae bacterium]